MKRNFLLFVVFLVGIILVVNSLRRLVSFRSTAQQVKDAEKRLETLKKESESLKRELEYKKSQDFAESEIRNRLGLVKEGETVVILPKDEKSNKNGENEVAIPNWQKWWNLFFGG
ncbi:hypothetical protein A3I53_03575 [Candidatus Curtissbacteria bacterium RIFCSPLOWO2_02_FULL_40_13b]|uniref:Septum formation initiator n=2 Tax=Candidatus Curtissiibacteriota TaxID=1752717 RepID=A0A1F5HXI9_9BACT|nr:MAG: hypothetical protein A2693_03080 [Candidatus Curtissbacteria bacterium RIFCSPHIGHO2_01_FULL_40_12]OGE08806.1 MAG: hypothetical protein A3I53_03575 [Candidatus Curtissbacteria bacterium RIFCSPLOWO2_02_FULL_40_13b]